MFDLLALGAMLSVFSSLLTAISAVIGNAASSGGAFTQGQAAAREAEAQYQKAVLKAANKGVRKGQTDE